MKPRIRSPMMNTIWGFLLILGIAWGLLNGRGATLSTAILETGHDALLSIAKLAGAFMLFSGLFQILEEGRGMRAVAKVVRPLTCKLFPDLDPKSPAMGAIALNLSANMLGLGNVATPLGLSAMQRMPMDGDAATDAMCMFLVLNASAVQLFPTTVVALRAAAGSLSPASIVLPTLLATATSTLVGVFACRFLKRYV